MKLNALFSRKNFRYSGLSGFSSSIRLFGTKKIDPVSLYEPIFPVPEKPVPTFDTLNIRLTGYDFQILERYQSYVARLARSMGFEVGDAWATPCSKTKASIYKAKTTVIMEEFILSKFQRDIQLLNAPSTKLSIFVDFLRTNLPKGVCLNFQPFSVEDEQKRYVPDYDLMELSKQLELTEKTISSMKIPTTKK